MVKRNITLGTLRHLAKIDNPQEYKLFVLTRSDKYITESLEGGHNDIAKALYEEFGDEFRCASVANRIWFQFIDHKWEQIENGIFLRKKISEDIVKRFAKAGIKLLQDSISANKDDQKQIHSKLKQINKMICNLKSATYKNNVMKECEEVFYDKKFLKMLDTNPYLFGFNNGVYDLKLNKFRRGIPDDYISRSAPIDYIDYNESDEKVSRVHSFLEKIFPDKSLREYFMNTSSDIFVGGNQEKIALFWTGEGDNGKSVTQLFFEKMLGNLAVKPSTTLITGKKPSSGSANPELARAGNGVRWMVLEEPGEDEHINIGTLKHLTGNDSYLARDLFQKGKETPEIHPMFKLVFICNNLPKLKYSDKATWNRIRVIPFESTFCKPEISSIPETIEEQFRQKRFPMDKKFHEQIPELLSAFAWVLLEHRKNITVRIEPEKVRQASEKYKRQNDVYSQFLEENIVEDNNVKNILSLADIYSSFKLWYRESIPNQSIPIRSDLENYLIKVWGNPERGKKWHGYRLYNDEDDKKEIDPTNLVNYDRLLKQPL